MRAHEILQCESVVTAVSKEPGGVYRALLSAPRIASTATPLQFVNLKVREGTSPLLRRPIGLSWYDRDSGLIEVTWAVVGYGTQIMSTWEVGQSVSVLGPLGNGFVVPAKAELPVDRTAVLHLVAGGTGLAPLYPLALMAIEEGYEVNLYYGARKVDLLQDTSRFVKCGARVRISVEDGSYGFRGKVTDLLDKNLETVRPGDTVVSCGPMPMQKAIKDCFGGLWPNLYICLEERMACGTGLCKGCAVKRADGKGYWHACTDGPVFLASDVLLDRGE